MKEFWHKVGSLLLKAAAWAIDNPDKLVDAVAAIVNTAKERKRG